MDLKSFSALEWAHKFIREHVKPGDLCIDATAGRGHDTALLCSLVGESGHVTAFDIQPDAIASTNARLAELGYTDRATVIQESHSRMEAYAQPGTISCITFNFGWLPGEITIFSPMRTPASPPLSRGWLCCGRMGS